MQKRRIPFLLKFINHYFNPSKLLNFQCELSKLMLVSFFEIRSLEKLVLEVTGK